MSEHNPYQPPAAALTIPVQTSTLTERVASRSSRFWAAGLDVVTTPPFYIGLVAGMNRRGMYEQLPPPLLLVFCALLLVVQGVLAARSGQSVGKWLLGIRIERPNGEVASFWRILLRVGAINGVNMISIVGPMLYLVDSLTIFSASRRCWHDHLTDTVVREVPVGAA